jgi:hypothetical protein
MELPILDESETRLFLHYSQPAPVGKKFTGCNLLLTQHTGKELDEKRMTMERGALRTCS